MEKKILKILMSNTKYLYPSELDACRYDIFINRHGFVYDKQHKEVTDLSFKNFEKRRVLTIMCSGIEEPLLLEQILTIQQIDILKYLYNYFGESFKLMSDIINDTSLLDKIASHKI